MSVVDLLKQRSATRAYQKTRLEESLIRKIFTQAQLSASNCNTQPWHVSIISGDACATLAKELVAHVSAGNDAAPVFQPGDHQLSGEYRDRQIACAVALYKTMGIGREDKMERMQLMLKNFEFFGAPHVAIFSMPKTMKEVNAVDVGIYLQSVMLLMSENGVACCPQGALAFYPDPIMAVTNIPEENGILFGLSFGYADADEKINEVKTTRAEFDEFAEIIA